MTTRAQQFKSDLQRKNRAQKQAKKARVELRRPSPDAGARNLTGHAAKKAAVVTEVSLSGKPSRKSSRGSAHHGKNSSALEYAARQRSFTPQHRHQSR